MNRQTLTETYPGHYKGEIEVEIRDRYGRVVQRIVEPNIVKIGAKEILAHRLIHNKIWDPDANTGSGAWTEHTIDPDGDFAAKYILFGASFDDSGAPLDSVDSRYYVTDTVTGTQIPIALTPGAEFGGGLINAVPVAEPDRPLKKIERIYFEPSYQPAGSPLIQDDVRAMNNTVVMETTLRSEEYNGFGLTSSDFFTITEVALAGGKELDLVDCNCDPAQAFLEGRGDDGPIRVTANGSDVVSILPADSAYSSLIREGDQIKLVTEDGTDEPDLVSPHFLVIRKEDGGSDIVLDRNVVDSEQAAISGTLGLYRNSLRLFSHRILSTPFKKSSSFEIVVRWKIRFN
jgi:hypothetical protein